MLICLFSALLSRVAPELGLLAPNLITCRSGSNDGLWFLIGRQLELGGIALKTVSQQFW
jgi:hypothetical protein